MDKSKFVFLSDIHIATNAPTNWYQKDLHESYLLSVLDWVIGNAKDIQELVLLGDFVDFWTCPCDEIPPNFSDIIKSNPNIFGDNEKNIYGKLSDVLTALKGKVSYVRGNHDMTITQTDLDQVKNPNPKYKITLQDDIYFPLGKDNPKLVCTHGHEYTMFNAPYCNNNPIKPLPLGFYITRSVASWRYKQIVDENGNFKNTEIRSVADLPSSGDPDPSDVSKALTKDGYLKLFTTVLNLKLTCPLLNAISEVTGINESHPIKLANGSITTIKQGKHTYENLSKEWMKRVDSRFETLFTAKSVFADLDGSYMGWFAQKLAFETNANLVVMGHTHLPILGLEKSQIGYVNIGFGCPSRPDIDKKQKQPTFLVVDYTKIIPDKGMVAQCAEIFQVVKGESNFRRYHAEATKVSEGIPINPIKEISKKGAEDCSCYVEIDNRIGNYDLILENFGAKHGYYIVPPPQKIAKGQMAKFWLQYPPIGEVHQIAGAENGWVKYYTENGETILLKYSCPYGTPSPSNPFNSNECSVQSNHKINFYTRTHGYEDWGQPNEIKKSGHPFFVKFVL